MPILKPLREFVSKEIEFYNNLQKIYYDEVENLGTKKSVKASLSKLSESFINGLSNDFPATVYTLFKISSKVEPSQGSDQKCLLCGVND